MAHGITLTLRDIQPRSRLFWSPQANGAYRNPSNPEKMLRAKHRNLLFGRKAVGNTTPFERREIWDRHTQVVQA